jgi:hypothetical protein
MTDNNLQRYADLEKSIREYWQPALAGILK